MSKIERYQGNVRAFASDAQGMERTVFGETNQADDLTSQITASFLRGWGVVGASEHPSLEDFNAAMYAMSQFIAYQHQMGIAEWHAQQEYHLGSICTHNGESYQSLQNANVGSQPPSAKWTPVLTSKNGLANLGLPELFADEKRFHTSPESVEMITPNGEIIIELTNNGYVNVINKSTGLLAEIPPTGLEQQAGSHQKRMMSQKGVTDLVKSVETPIGMFATFPHRATQLPPKWYSTNGDRFSVSSPQGLALKSLPAELKSDWGITESGGMINVPNIKQSDGRAPFLRPVNGTNRQVGSVDGDKMRRIYGEYANSSWRDPGDGWGSASGVFDVRYDSGISGSTGSNKGTVLVFDTNKVVDTGPEFKPLDIGVTLAVYLGA